MRNNQIAVGGAIVFRDSRGKRQFFLTKQGGGDKWEIPKVAVRKGESSVRSVLRLTGEMAGMNTRVLEEAGRANALVSVNGKSIPQRFYYYLLLYKAGGEILGFQDFVWLEYAEALKRLELKREKDMLRSASKVLKKWERERQEKS
ncbi:MAG: NUDIX domain-containing protein [Patescibacteria group bacterium]